MLGWRSWRLHKHEHGPRLASLFCPAIWQPGQAQQAHCSDGGCQPAPVAHCHCGLYAAALDHPDAAFDYLLETSNLRFAGLRTAAVADIFGTVSLWGRVIVTEAGYRAQYAYPQELFIVGRAEIAALLGESYQIPARALSCDQIKEQAAKIASEQSTSNDTLHLSGKGEM